MKTKQRPNRRGKKLRYPAKRQPVAAAVLAPAPFASGIAPPSFTCPNFKDGRSIAYTFTRDGYRYQLAGDEAVETGLPTYTQAAAHARRKYGMPAIGCQSLGKGVAA